MGWKEEFGSSIRAVRQKSGTTLRALAHAVGVTPETIRQYELGRIPDADKLAKIALALKTSEFVLNDFRILITQRADASEVANALKGEQLRLDFSSQYESSTAKIQIRPGSIAVTFTGIRLDKAS